MRNAASQTEQGLRVELERTRARLAELEATSKAIHSGDVDAIVVDGPNGSQIYTLQSPEEPYRILAERMNEGAATLTTDGTILFCNRRLAEMVGLPAERLLGSSIFSLWGADRQPNLAEMLQSALTSDVRVEGKMLRHDGKLVPVQLSLNCIAPDGSEQVICLIATDLSEVNRMKQGLREQAQVFDLAHDAIIICGLDGRIQSWNRGATDLYGWSADEALGKLSVDLLRMALPKPWETMCAALQESEEWAGEHTQTRRDGSEIIVESRWSLWRDEEGRPSAVLKINRDITARTQAQHARTRAEKELRELNRDLESRVEARTLELRESERHVRRKLDSILSPEGELQCLELADILDLPAVQALVEDVYRLTRIPIAILDLEGNLLVGAGWQDICTNFHRANPATCENCKESDCELSMGVAPGEFKLYKCKNNMWDMATPIMLGDRHIGNLFSGQVFFSDEAVDESLFAAQATQYGFDQEAYLDALRRVPRVRREDVHAAMSFYGNLAKLLLQLGHSGVKLARAMTETRHTNDQLEESVKELETFAYSVSHDLRAPLRHMDGYLTLLSKRSYSQLDDSAKHYVDCALDASQRMGVLIDDLLQFSRLGRAEMRKVPVDLNAIVDQMRTELEPATSGRSIQWHVEPLPKVAADTTMIRQVIGNLLGNAVKFTRNCATADIEIGSRIAPNEVVVFVRDNGAGFDMQYYQKLFQVFQRLHSEEEFEGTGIGLANVRRMVERHGGRVWAEGNVGAGATFYFSLPQSGTNQEETNELTQSHLAG